MAQVTLIPSGQDFTVEHGEPVLAGALRAGLRERFRRSPLADYEQFTRDLEQAYAEMWEAWLAAPRAQ